MDEEKLPLSNTPRPELNKRYPGHFFMTMFNKETGKQVLVGTRKSLTLQPLYFETPAQNDEEIQVAAEIVVESIQKKYDKALVYRGRPFARNKGGIISGYKDPYQYQDELEARRESLVS